MIATVWEASFPRNSEIFCSHGHRHLTLTPTPTHNLSAFSTGVTSVLSPRLLDDSQVHEGCVIALRRSWQEGVRASTVLQPADLRLQIRRLHPTWLLNALNTARPSYYPSNIYYLKVGVTHAQITQHR